MISPPNPSERPAKCAEAPPDAQNLGLDAAQQAAAAKPFDINNLTVVAKSLPDTDSSHLGADGDGVGKWH